MIAIDFEYYKPSIVEDAVTLFEDLRADHKKPVYYGGGTELISRARLNELAIDAVIDLKGIAECRELSHDQNQIIIGATVTLSNLVASNQFPLLADVSRRIATHTARNKITIGGNISGHLFYREALLPFLLADSEVVIAGKEGIRKTAISGVYQKGIQLKEGEFVVQVTTDEKVPQYPYFNLKKTKQSNVSYPVVSLACMQMDGRIRVALSGVCHFPFRLEQIEAELNNTSHPYEKRIRKAIKHLPASILDDQFASREYRTYVLESALMETLERAEGVSG